MIRVAITIISFLMFISSASAQYSLKEQKIGEKVFKLMNETYGFYEDEALQGWVEKVGKQLETQLPPEYTFQYFITDQNDLNAFATAGGYVFVTRGLLALVSNDDELAGVLAHEISHVTEKHATKSNRASIIPSLLELPANIIGALTYSEIGDILNLPIELTAGLALSAYSRSQERDADKMGVELAHKAGFNPYSLMNALTKLDEFTKTAYDIETKKNLYNDHPMTEDRVKYLNELLTKMEVEEVAMKSGSTVQAQDGLVFGQNPQKVMLRNNVAIHLGLRFYMEFPEGYTVNKSNRALTAVSEDGRSTILITIDSLTEQPEATAKLELSQLNDVSVIDEGKDRVNGMESYKALIEQSKTKYPDMKGEIHWVKNPISGKLIRIVTLTPIEEADSRIQESISSLRLLKMDELDDWTYWQLNLVEDANLEQLAKEGPQFVRILQLLNDLKEDEYTVDEGMKYKVLERKTISEYR